ncbi:MAG: tetratricopeptide repeat protein, partial [bacterium]
MNYQCSNTLCSMSSAVLPEASAIGMGMKCPVCQAGLVSVRGAEPTPGAVTDAWTARVIATYPILIAQPLAVLASKRDVEAQAKTLVDVFTNALKYLALVVETEYLYSPYQSEVVNRILDDDLERPLVSAWNKLLREALPFLAQAGHKPFIPELKPFYDNVEAGKPRVRIPGKGYYDDDGHFVPTESKLGLITALISYRNNFAHGLNQPEVDARSDFEFYHDLLRQMLEGMSWCVRYPLFKRENGRWINLMGEHPVEADSAPKNVPPDVTLVLGSPESERNLSLIPFLIVPRDFIADAAAGEDVLMYDQTTRKRILYVSPRGHQRETKGTIEHWRKLIESKCIKLSVLTTATLNADELAARFDRVTREITQRKGNLVAGAYLSRPAPELELRIWPGTSYPLAALGASAGAGKTCLLEHMVATWSTAGHEVLLITCGRIEHRDFMGLLRDRLALADEVDLRTLSGTLWKSGRRWVVVLDGLNEHPHREQFLASVIASARELGSAGLRIVFSFRTEVMDWLKVTDADRRLFVVPSSADKADLEVPGKEVGVPHIPVVPLDMVERAAMWRLYAKCEPDRYKPAFGFNDMVAESRELAGFLSNPLLLRLFLQVYHNRAIPGHLSRSAFMAEYLKSIFTESGDKGQFLLELGRVFWARKVVRLTVDELFDVPALADAVRSSDVNSPYRKLTSARCAVLVEWREGDDRHVMFAAEAVMEALLGAVLGESNPGAAELAAMLADHSDYPPARRAITEALLQAVEKAGVKILAQFIPDPGKGTAAMSGEVLAGLVRRFHSQRASIAAVRGEVLTGLLLAGRDPAELAQELKALTPSTSNYDLWYASDEAGDRLLNESEYLTAAKFFETLLDWHGDVMPDGRHFAGILLKAGRSRQELGDHKKAMDHLQCALALKWKAPRSHVATILNNIGLTYSRLGDYAKALEYEMRALELRRKALGEEHPHVATSLNSIGGAYSQLGVYAKALEFEMRALELRRKAFGEEHPAVATSLNNIGLTYGKLGAYAKALEYGMRALELLQKAFGEEHPHVAISLGSIGFAYGQFGDHPKALEYELRALELQRKVFGEEHPDVAISLNNIGCTYSQLGDHTKALEYGLRALELRRKAFGEEHPDVAIHLNNIGCTYSDLGDHTKALEYGLR